MWYFTGKGIKPSGPSHGKPSVSGNAGMPSRRASPDRFAKAGLLLLGADDPDRTIGVRVSSASRMKPSPKRCSS